MTTPPTLPPPPRRVNEDPRFAAADRPKRIFIAVGAGTGVLYFLFMLWGMQSLRTLHTVQGRVVDARIVHGKWTGHVLDFEYLADGQLRRGSDNVDTSTWKKFVGSDGRVVPGPITVNVSRVGPLHTALLRKNETPMLMWFIVPAAFCMVPWIGYALWYLRLAPARARRICATGTAVPCTITEKRTRQKKGCTIYDLAYEFHAGPQQIRGKFTTDPGAWAPVPVPQACVSVQPGQTLTALYLPDNPRRHLVYELSRFVIS